MPNYDLLTILSVNLDHCIGTFKAWSRHEDDVAAEEVHDQEADKDTPDGDDDAPDGDDAPSSEDSDQVEPDPVDDLGGNIPLPRRSGRKTHLSKVLGPNSGFVVGHIPGRGNAPVAAQNPAPAGHVRRRGHDRGRGRGRARGSGRGGSVHLSPAPVARERGRVRAVPAKQPSQPNERPWTERRFDLGDGIDGKPEKKREGKKTK
jgi:hypothetical protein